MLCLAGTAVAAGMPDDENTTYPCEQKGKTEVVKYLLVWDKEGGFVSFPLEERPRIIADVANSKIRCITSKQEVEFPMADVHKYTLDADPEHADVEEITPEEGTFRKDEYSLLFENYKPGTPVSVYLINGMAVTSDEIDADGRLSVSMLNWETGVYLVKVGSITYKIIRK